MENAVNYINTLIFLIIAKLVTFIVLFFIFTDWGQRYVYVLVTIEIMLIIVIIVTTIKLIYNDKLIADREKEMNTKPAKLQECPDYYTKTSNNDGDVLCENEYNTPDGYYMYKMGTENLSSINLTDIDQNGKRTLREVCDVVNNSESEYYKNIAWTYIKPTCNAL